MCWIDMTHHKHQGIHLLFYSGSGAVTEIATDSFISCGLLLVTPTVTQDLPLSSPETKRNRTRQKHREAPYRQRQESGIYTPLPGGGGTHSPPAIAGPTAPSRYSIY